MNGRKKFANIQALRGVAALLVLLAHIKEAETDYGGEGVLLPHVFYMGVTGVDLFFLISGFVMAIVGFETPAGVRSAIRFALDRAARIYPLYWLVTASLLILYAGKAALFGEDTPIPNAIASVLLAPSDHFPILPVAWTLVHEMYFYLAFTIIILAPRESRTACLVAWGVTIALGMVLGAFDGNAWTRIAFNPITAEFLVGVLIAYLIRSGVTRYAGVALFAGCIWLGVLCLGFSDALYPSVFASFADRALLFTPPYALILYGAASIELAAGRLAPRWLIKTGDASYALYLTHVPVFLVAGKTVSELTPDGVIDNVILIAAFAIAATTTGFMAHAFVERPLLRTTRDMVGRLAPRPAPAALG